MFNFFETMAELFDAVELHRLWLYGLSAAVIFLAWALYKTHLRIKDLENKKENKKDKKESFFHDNLF